MLLIEAQDAAKDGSRMVRRTSKSWWHRGIFTVFDQPDDLTATDWEPCPTPEPFNYFRSAVEEECR